MSSAESAPRFGNLTPQEAGRRSAEVRRKAREQGDDRARRTSARSPLDSLRDLLASDPEKYAAGLARLIETGDPRSMSVIQQLFKVDDTIRIPRAERLVRDLDRDQRRALLLELEAKGAVLPDCAGDPDGSPGATLPTRPDEQEAAYVHTQDAGATRPHTPGEVMGATGEELRDA